MVIAVSLTITGFSQELPRHVFCSGGDSYEAAAVQLSWTIGQAEPLATTFHPGAILGSGFQQFDDQLVSVREINEDHAILLYPNPCHGQSWLKADFNQTTLICYTLYDFSGKALLSNELSGQLSYQEAIDLSNFPPGIYNLMLTMESGNRKYVESIKVIRN